MRYTSIHDLVVVRARVEGPAGVRPSLLAVDTGAAMTMLRPAVLRAIGALEVVDRVPLSTVGGIVQADRVVVTRIHALGEVRENLVVVARDLPPTLRIHGLLGLDFLRNSRLTIDFRRGEIELES